MAIKWVGAYDGSDSTGDGSEAKPYKTIANAFTQAADGDFIYLKNGVYRETNLTMPSAKALWLRGMGSQVWIDAWAASNAYSALHMGSAANKLHVVENLKFFNFGVEGGNQPAIEMEATTTPANSLTRGVVRNCTFIGRLDSSAARTGRAINVSNGSASYPYRIENCHFTRLNYGVFNAGGDQSIVRNCILEGVTTTLGNCTNSTKNAYAGATGDNVNLTTHPPTYMDSGNWDFTVDPAGTHGVDYIGAGYGGANIGVDGGQVYPISSWASILGFGSGSLLGEWVNDATCYDPTPPSITISSANGNNKLDFYVSSDLTATIADTTTSNMTTLATAIQDALTAQDANMRCEWIDATKRFRVYRTSGNWTAKWATGSNHANSCGPTIGFDVDADDTGATTYTANWPVTQNGSSPFEMTISSARGNNKIDFKVHSGGTTYAATIADTTSTSMSTIAAAIKTALDAAAPDGHTFTVTWNGTDEPCSKMFRITIDTGTFDLLWNTGTNKATSVCKTIGFVDTADLTGAGTYRGSKSVTGGPVVIDASYRPVTDYGIEPDARLSRYLSPVIDRGQTRNPLRRICWSEVNDLANKKEINYPDSHETGVLDRSIQARAHKESFSQTAADSGLDRNFTEIEKDTAMAWYERFFQVKLCLRTVIP